MSGLTVTRAVIPAAGLGTRFVTAARGGELQLTDALAALVGRVPVWAYQLEGVRLDVGTLPGYLRAMLALAWKRKELWQELSAFIRDLGDEGS